MKRDVRYTVHIRYVVSHYYLSALNCEQSTKYIRQYRIQYI